MLLNRVCPFFLEEFPMIVRAFLLLLAENLEAQSASSSIFGQFYLHAFVIGRLERTETNVHFRVLL